MQTRLAMTLTLGLIATTAVSEAQPLASLAVITTTPADAAIRRTPRQSPRLIRRIVTPPCTAGNAR